MRFYISKDTVTYKKIFRQLVILFFIAFLIFKMDSLLVPFMTSFIIAYILRKPRDILVNKCNVPNALATLVLISFVIFLLVVSVILLVPLVKNTTSKAIHKIPVVVDAIANFVAARISRIYTFFNVERDITIEEDVQLYFRGLLQYVPSYMPNIITASKAIINIVLYIILIPVLSFYMLYDFNKIEIGFMRFIMGNFPHKLAIIMKDINYNIEQYLKGQFLISCILFTLYSVSLWAVGINDYGTCAIITGFMSFMPFVGTFIGLFITVAISIDTITSMQLYCVLAVYFTVVMIDSNFITPNLIGKKIGIDPLMLLFVICLSASLFGVSGLVLSTPISVIIVTIIKGLSYTREKKV